MKDKPNSSVSSSSSSLMIAALPEKLKDQKNEELLKNEQNYIKALTSQSAPLSSFIDKEGNTLLHVAAHENYIELMNFLLGTGKMHVDAKNHRQQTALHLACELGRFNFFLNIVKYKPELFATDVNGNTLLHLLCANGRETVDEKLIATQLVTTCPILINQQNHKGKTPLWLANDGSKYGIAKLLLERGANLDTEDNNEGLTPRDKANQGYCPPDLLETILLSPRGGNATRKEKDDALSQRDGASQEGIRMLFPQEGK